MSKVSHSLKLAILSHILESFSSQSQVGALGSLCGTSYRRISRLDRVILQFFSVP